jgi:putative hydrolase of the HAD superfamily
MSEQAIQAVIFDLGGVLVRTPDRSSRLSWEHRLGLEERGSEEIVFSGEMGTKAQRGEISNDELWQWVGQHLQLDEGELSDFQRAFWAGDRLDKELVALIRQLRPRYQTAILSNATNGLRSALESVYPIADAFDLIVCSAEEGLMKPDRRIFEVTLGRLGRQPEEAVFIDDSTANIAGAREVGLHTIHFSPTVDVAAELARLGVLV